MRRLPLTISLVFLCLCAGCGQTGPLYLPAEEPASSESGSAE